MIVRNLIFSSLIFLISFGAHAVPKEQSKKKIIMAVFAHPDDEAGTNVTPLLAKYAREGHTVYLVFATKGELGVAKHANIPAGEPLALTRAAEAACACEYLGIKPPIMLGLGDGSLSKTFTGRPLHEKLDSLFRTYNPDIVITWGPDGGYGHMDHRIVHDIVTELVQSGQLSKPNQLYYSGIPTENWKQTPKFKTAVGKLVENWNTVKKEYLTVRIKCTPEDTEKSIAAMYCHKSQYTTEQLDDIKLWMLNTNRDTVYLRPFKAQEKITYRLF